MQTAVQHHQAGRLAEAEETYRQILSQVPDHPDVLHFLGVVSHQRNRAETAADLIRRAIVINPAAADYHANLGNVLIDRGLLDEAIAAYRRAIQLKADHAVAHCNLGNALTDKGLLDEAIAAYRQAIQIEPNHAGAYHGLGIALGKSGRVEEAIAAYHQALRIRPEFAMAYVNLGATLRNNGRVEEAIAAYRRAVQLNPDDAKPHYGLAVALQINRQWQESLDTYRNAIARGDNYARLDYGMLLLAMGHWTEGWREMEWWEEVIPGAKRFPQPPWDGSRAPGKTLLVYCSWGGYGDAIHLARFLPLLREKHPDLIFECRKTLAPLFAHSFAPVRIVPHDQTLPHFDLYVRMESLPHLLGITLENLPALVPYLSAPPQRVAAWAGRVRRDGALNVGLVWSDGSTRRAVPIDVFAPLAQVPGVRLFSLQKGKQASQKPPHGMNLIDYSADLHDFADTAALVHHLDLIISVDTCVVHLAGAMNKPTWVLISRQSDWRWLLDRTDSPWYPSVRLFRQGAHDDWMALTRQMAQELAGTSDRAVK
jgi:tetratricopeptide (TPR) repeat protein